MRSVLVLIAVLAVTACGDNTTAPHGVGQPADTWIGRWNGPEGLFLQLMPTNRPGHYRLTLKDNLDSQMQYDAVARDGALHFKRNGKQQSVHPGSGRDTGFSDLFGKTDCLIVIAGTQGYCRTSGTADALPLKRGTYVDTASNCANPSFAGLKFFNGRGLAGAHTSDCKAAIVAQHGLTFTLDNDCKDTGSGAAPSSVARETIVVADDEHFTLREDNGNTLRMKYCPFDQLPDSLRQPAS